MTLTERIHAFAGLGKKLENLPAHSFAEICDQVLRENPWFTPENIRMALTGVSLLLTETELQRWTSAYPAEPQSSKTVGVVMAGNIPMVGFHDFLCVLISGHSLKAKLSGQDTVLLSTLASWLIAIEPRFKDRIFFEERLNHTDAMIATGSNNTARYFEYYFRDIPHIIRKNRSSCAVISGQEQLAEPVRLGIDVFSYFGLGCRNVSKLYVPEGYDFVPLLSAWEKYQSIIHHHKYVNNYDYQKSILLVNKIPFYDNGFIILKEEASFVSPISVLFYEFYSNPADLALKLARHAEKIQCIVSADGWWKNSEDFGQAQYPKVDDYADRVDTLKFLNNL